MKIAVTSTGKTLDSQVDQRFGRAAYFIVVDTETMDFSTIENESVAAAGGAGRDSRPSSLFPRSQMGDGRWMMDDGRWMMDENCGGYGIEVYA